MQLPLYQQLDNLKFLKKSLTAKILFVSFLGTHVPLIALLSFFLFLSDLPLSAHLDVLIIALIATLIGTTLTLLGLFLLLSPVRMTASALENYRKKHILPKLPTMFKDEAGILMANTQLTLEELSALMQSVQEEALTDALTGLLNRRALIKRLDSAIARKESLIISLIDLNKFKQINDTYGHKAGDEVLTYFSKALKTHSPTDSWIARLGGDEFVMLFENSSSVQVKILFDQVRLYMQKHPLALENGVQITPEFSVGIQTINSPCSAEMALERADAAMYRDKKSNR